MGAPSGGNAGGAGGILSDDLSEEELEIIFRERRAKIDREFKKDIEEPASFMRQMPFQLDPDDSTSRILNGGVGRDEEDSVPGSPKRSVSSVFLTGGSDESIENSRADGRSARRKASAPQAGSPAPSPSPPSPVGVTLPPIAPSSRGSSA